jgi:Fic family protein
MKMPVTPPHFPDLIRRIDPSRLPVIFSTVIGAAPEGKYRHWDTLRHVTPPEGLTAEEWWLTIKMARLSAAVQLPLSAKDGAHFRYSPVDVVQQMLMQVDRNASGQIQAGEPITDPQTRDIYLLKGLMEEAITSSQLEGASTTREVAKEMIQKGREPRTTSERMIYNNFQALQFIRRLEKAPLTSKIVFELHEVLTAGTLDNPDAAGRFRTADESICVQDEVGNVLHTPPPAAELGQRLADMCAFANGKLDGSVFIHPVVRAITLHFWLAYDHPFVDGNGRTARALFYWSMSREGYWLAEFISISRILKNAPGQYSRSFLYTETDDNDLTYFLLYQLGVILRAIHDLFDYLHRKEREIQSTRLLIERSSALRQQLNFRQLAIIRHAMKHPRFTYTIESHRTSNNISYATARADLLKLAEVGLLERRKGRGKLMLFISPNDIQQRIQRAAAS